MTYIARSAALGVLLFTLWSCGGSGSSPPIGNSANGNLAPPPTSIGGTSDQFLYVPNFTGDSVTVYAKTANGNVTPIRTISGSNTELFSPSGTAFDSAGNLYVASWGSQGCCISVFSPGANGDAVPIRLIGPQNPSLSGPTTLAVDANNNIWATMASELILPFTPKESGNTPSSATSAVAPSILSTPSDVVIDNFGLLWGTNCCVPSPGIAAVPVGTCATTVAFASLFTGFVNPQALTVDAQRNIYVADGAAIKIFSFSARRNAGHAHRASQKDRGSSHRHKRAARHRGRYRRHNLCREQQFKQHYRICTTSVRRCRTYKNDRGAADRIELSPPSCAALD